ncbi:MAG: DNA polymerase III subunit beta, partial [Actinomadura rubrobrunea]|nr:DNA polymerase III subunit beta [Actinomadura rubrobrunea]
FINYRSRLTDAWTTTVRIRTAPFVEAIKRVALVTERNTPIRLDFTGDEVRIRAAAGDAARANETMPALLTGDQIDIAFSPQYLLDGLAGIDTEYTRLECTGPTRPALLTGIPDRRDEDSGAEIPPDDPGDTGFRYLLMPIRMST